MKNIDYELSFEKANSKMHPIETQWHYKIMTEYGYVSGTPPQQGFVRSYIYTHPHSGRAIRVTTGVNADYWNDLQSGEFGYHADLEPHIKGKQQAK